MASKAKTKKAGKGKEEGTKKDDKPKINFEELVFSNLSNPKLTLDQSGYHFVDCNLSGKNIDLLSNVFGNFKHIQNIDLSHNNISDFSQLALIPSLVNINLSHNNIKDLKTLYVEENYKNLKKLNLAKNRVIEIQALKPPVLTELNLENNLVDKLEAFEGHPKLKVLNLSGNKISNLATMGNMPELKELYLSYNRIKQLQGLEFPQLILLHLRGNAIEYLFEESWPQLDNLAYLNIRENKIEKFEEIQKLAQNLQEKLPQLRTLIHSFNPFIPKNPKYLYETINLMLPLQRINKINITKNIKMSAFAYAEEQHNEKLRKEKEERERLEREQQEEEERAAAENA